MPELPDITVYCQRLSALFEGQTLEGFRVSSPFILRTFEPPAAEFIGRRLRGTSRIGKRICLVFEGGLTCVVHLMIAGRLRKIERGAPIHKKLGLLSLDFETESILLTEAGTKKRASVHLFRAPEEAKVLDRGGLEPLEISVEQFMKVLRGENRTIKRALADPRLLSGIGNAFSDEILFWAELSPVRLSGQMTDEEFARLYVATRHTLRAWTRLLTQEVGSGFPEKVTAFREEMAVHGRFKMPCRVCGTAIQRIRYASNETNYCPRCQTGGKLLADRSLSRLLKKDWPKSIDDLEA
jgi:formamidopyrimidine-DNA glycosylase